MDIENRIKSLHKLGQYIKEDGEVLQEVKLRARVENPWFTLENIDQALTAIATEMLDEQVLRHWISKYNLKRRAPLNVGLILAGNIPLVGFHDILCTYLSGHHSKVKSSSKDTLLPQHLLSVLKDISRDEEAFEFVDNLKGIDAIIATGSNHSAKQFERYFAKLPRILRRNRNAVAVLTGSESNEELVEFGKDVFQYFGLGCRNVSKVFIPSGMDKTRLMKTLHDHYSYLIKHNKYKNNYDYNYAVYLLNQDEFLASGAVILRKHKDIVSRIACLHYEEYDDIQEVELKLHSQLSEIQCIASMAPLKDIKTVKLGQCQKPKIDDYADNVDTMSFLTNL